MTDRQLNILTNGTTTLRVYSALIPNDLVTGFTNLYAVWSVKNMNHVMTLHEMSLDVSGSLQTKNKKIRYII